MSFKIESAQECLTCLIPKGHLQHQFYGVDCKDQSQSSLSCDFLTGFFPSILILPVSVRSPMFLIKKCKPCVIPARHGSMKGASLPFPRLKLRNKHREDGPCWPQHQGLCALPWVPWDVVTLAQWKVIMEKYIRLSPYQVPLWKETERDIINGCRNIA